MVGILVSEFGVGNRRVCVQSVSCGRSLGLYPWITYDTYMFGAK
jgi:hypothetical protein